MIYYNQRTGVITRDSALLGIAYSGHDEGLNNPAMESVRMIGPIPRGLWRMLEPRDSKTTGKYTIPLIMVRGDSFKRDLFRVHGDNRYVNKSASHGCVVAMYKTRVEMYTTSGDKLITVG